MGNKLGTEYVPPPESGVGPKKHFCVIGAGSSALIIMKVHKDIYLLYTLSLTHFFV